jgi:PKD repeat protein
MRKLLLITCLIFSVGITKAQVKKVLFVGNSYTYVNDLPQLLKDVALSFNDTIVTDQSTPGGATFNAHTTNSTTMNKIALGTFDYVVLQAQSQEPSFSPGQVASQTYPYAQTLVNAIRAANECTEPMFFMTWGRQNGDAVNCQFYPPICTYDGMQHRLRQSYLEMANVNQSTVSPVGVAWKNVRDNDSLINLYSPDESHPSLHGSYLAACVFYTTLYQKSSIGSTSIPTGISASEALILQTIASYTVLDSMALWRINANLPIANFNYTGGGTINFTNTSTNGVYYYWDFGDGNSSTLENPSNVYTASNTYPVQLITFSADSCFSDTITQNLNVIVASVEDAITNLSTIELYPNPANNFVQIKSEEKFTSTIIRDVTGKIVRRFSKQSKIDVTHLQNGIYFLTVYDNSIPLKTLKLVRK